MLHRPCGAPRTPPARRHTCLGSRKCGNARIYWENSLPRLWSTWGTRGAFIIMIGRRVMLEQQPLVLVLLRVAVAASLASILSRFGAFQRMLMREERTLVQRIRLALSCSALFGASVATRIL